MKKERTSPKRLVINIDEDFHRELKIAAARQFMNMSQYVLQTVAVRIRNEKISLNIK